MGNNWHLALQHIKDNLGAVVIMMLELLVVLVLATSFLASLLESVKSEALYEQLQLDQVAEVREGNVSDLPDSVKIINDAKRSFRAGYGNVEYRLQGASAAYFSHFRYPLRKGTMPDSENTTTVQGIFPDALKHVFQVGKTYTFTYESAFELQSLEVLMVGQMEENYIYDTHRFEPGRKTILLYDGGGLITEPGIYNFYVTVFVEDASVLTTEQAELLSWFREVREREEVSARQNRGTSIVISILLLVLGLATFAGYNFMQMLQKEKFYGVYYLCGASWKDCVQIQLLVDGITLSIPLSATMILLFLYEYFDAGTQFEEPLLSWEGFGIMAAICLLTFLLTSLEGILRLRKKSPVAIIEKWNQT